MVGGCSEVWVVPHVRSLGHHPSHVTRDTRCIIVWAITLTELMTSLHLTLHQVCCNCETIPYLCLSLSLSLTFYIVHLCPSSPISINYFLPLSNSSYQYQSLLIIDHNHISVSILSYHFPLSPVISSHFLSLYIVYYLSQWIPITPKHWLFVS